MVCSKHSWDSLGLAWEVKDNSEGIDHTTKKLEMTQISSTYETTDGNEM
jgi:hypothetical protein